jgi:hypothetical protein
MKGARGLVCDYLHIEPAEMQWPKGGKEQLQLLRAVQGVQLERWRKSMRLQRPISGPRPQHIAGLGLRVSQMSVATHFDLALAKLAQNAAAKLLRLQNALESFVAFQPLTSLGPDVDDKEKGHLYWDLRKLRDAPLPGSPLSPIADAKRIVRHLDDALNKYNSSALRALPNQHLPMPGFEYMTIVRKGQRATESSKPKDTTATPKQWPWHSAIPAKAST